MDTGGPAGDAGTTVDFDLEAPADCIGTAGPEGSACAVATSADSLMPGAIPEGRGTSLQTFHVRVKDSGANGLRGDADDRTFAQQGIFVP